MLPDRRGARRCAVAHRRADRGGARRIAPTSVGTRLDRPAMKVISDAHDEYDSDSGLALLVMVALALSRLASTAEQSPAKRQASHEPERDGQAPRPKSMPSATLTAASMPSRSKHGDRIA